VKQKFGPVSLFDKEERGHVSVSSFSHLPPQSFPQSVGPVLCKSWSSGSCIKSHLGSFFLTEQGLKLLCSDMRTWSLGLVDTCCCLMAVSGTSACSSPTLDVGGIWV